MSAVAYIYEADVHCPDCALARFGEPSGDGEYLYLEARDAEGNVPGPIDCHDELFEPKSCSHDWESGPFVVGCGTCSRVIAGQATDEEPLYEGGDLTELREQWRIDREASLQRQIEELDAELRGVTDARGALVEGFERFARGLCDLGELLALLESEGEYAGRFNLDSRALRLAADLRSAA